MNKSENENGVKKGKYSFYYEWMLDRCIYLFEAFATACFSRLTLWGIYYGGERALEAASNVQAVSTVWMATWALQM